MTNSYQKGRGIAEGHNQFMALVFTGSDWSENSGALLSEMAKVELPREIVFVHVDFPELNIQSQEILEQNHALKDRYNIHSFPTVVLIGTDENEITRLGYPITRAPNFIHHLKKLGTRYSILKRRYREACKDRLSEELTLCFQVAKELGASHLAKEILDFAMQESLSPELMLEKYSALKGAGKMDEAHSLREMLLKEGKEEIFSRMALFDFQEQESLEPLETFLEQYSKKQGDHFWRIHLVISEYLLKEGQKEEALEHAQVSYRYASPENRENISILISKMLH